MTANTLNFLSSENFAIQSTSLSTSAASNYSIQTLGGPINLQSGSISLQSDLQSINSEGPVNFISTAGQIDLIADESATIYGLNTFLNGNNQLSVSSHNNLNVNAGSQFIAKAGIIEFYSPNNINLATSKNDINLFAGNGILLTSFNIGFSGVAGVEFTSADSEILLFMSAQLVSSAQTLEVQADANVILQSNGPVNINSAKTLSLNMNGDFNIHSSSFSFATGNATFSAPTVSFSTNSDFNVVVDGTGSPASVTGSTVTLAANNIATSSASLSYSTQSGSVIFKTDQFGSAFLSFTNIPSTLSAPLIAFDSGNIAFSAGGNINLNAQSINFFVDRKSFSLFDIESPLTVSGAGVHNYEAKYLVDSSTSPLTISATLNLNIQSGDTERALVFNPSTFSTNIVNITNFSSDKIYFQTSGALQLSSNKEASIQTSSFRSFSNSIAISTPSLVNITTPALLEFDIATTLDLSASSFVSFVVEDSIEISSGSSTILFNTPSFIANFEEAFFSTESASSITSATTRIQGSLSLNVRDQGTVDVSSNIAFLNSGSTIDWYVDEHGGFSFISGSADFTGSSTQFITQNFQGTFSSDFFVPDATVNFKSTDQGATLFTANGEWSVAAEAAANILSNGNIYISAGSFSSSSMTGASFLATNDFRTYGSVLTEKSTGDLSYNSGNGLYFSATTSSFTSPLLNSLSSIDTAITGGAISMSAAGMINIGEGEYVYFYTPYELSQNTITATGVSFSENSVQIIAPSTTITSSAAPFSISSADILAIVGHDTANFMVGGNLLFDGSNTNGSFTFQSGHFNAYAASGTSITFASTSSFQVQAGSTSELLYAAVGGSMDFTVGSSVSISSGFRYNVSANSLSYNALSGISITNNDAYSTVEFLCRDGPLTFSSFTGNQFTANNITLHAANNFFFETYTLVSQGIDIQATGSVFDPYFGAHTGVSVHSLVGEIFFDVPLGSFSVSASSNFELQQQVSRFVSQTSLNYTASAGNITLAGGNNATFTTAQGNILLQSNTGNVELISTTTFTQNSTLGAVSFTSSNSSASNAIEFSSNSGGINITANSDQNINYNSGTNTTVRSGYSANITAGTFVNFQATKGQFNLVSGDELSYAVDDGNLIFVANQNVTLYTAGYYGVNISSGFDANWIAQTGSISVTTESVSQMRTDAGNALFQTISPTGNVSVTSGASIRVQADSTDNSVASNLGADGIFVSANNINVKTVSAISLDNEGIFTLGYTTTPIISISSGGDLQNPGFSASSYGGISISSPLNFNLKSADQFGTYAADSLQMQTNGQIQVISAGTSTNGGDVDFSAKGDFSVNANLVNVIGTQAFTLSGGEILNIQSVHNNVNINSATDIIANVNGTLGIDAATWSVVSNSFDFFAAGDITVTTMTGNILLDGQTGLSFVSNNDISFYTLGTNAPLSLTTTENNSPITIQANDTSSNVGFLAQKNTVGFTSSNGIFINAFEGVVLSALDIFGTDNVDQGNIYVTAQDDITASATGTLFFEAANGISSSTTNPSGASISLSADGQFLSTAYGNILFYSSARDVIISGPEANLPISVSTTPGDSGSVVFESTRNLLFSIENSASLFYNILGDSQFYTGRTFTVNAGNQLTIATNGTAGDLSINSAYGGVSFTVDNNINIDAQVASISATNAVSFIFEDNVYSAGSNSINIADSSATQKSTITTTKTMYAYATDVSLQLNDFAAGTLLNVTSPNGNINIFTPGVGRVIAGASATFLSSQGAIALSVSNPFSKFVVTSTGTLGSISVYSATNFQAYALGIKLSASSPNGALINVQDFNGAINFDASQSGLAQSNSNKDGFGIAITSSHPLGNINFFSSDYLIGNINFQVTSTFSGYALEDFTIENRDDDNTNAVGTFLMSSKAAGSYIGRQVVLAETGFGNIVVQTVSSAASRFIAAGAISVTTSNRFELTGNTQATFNAGSDVTFNAGLDIAFSGFTSNIIQAAAIVLGGQGTATFTGSNTVTISNNFGLNFPSLEVEMIVSSTITTFVSSAIGFYLKTPSGERGDLYIPDSAQLIIPYQSGNICSVGNQFFLNTAAPSICFCPAGGIAATCF